LFVCKDAEFVEGDSVTLVNRPALRAKLQREHREAMRAENF
jgi:hypothetical protein